MWFDVCFRLLKSINSVLIFPESIEPHSLSLYSSYKPHKTIYKTTENQMEAGHEKYHLARPQ